MQLRLFTIFSVYLFLAGCSDDASKGKILSFRYSTLYLKVINQNGQPVSGVETDVTHGGAYSVLVVILLAGQNTFLVLME